MSTPLTDEQLAEIEAREQKATPGPWGIGAGEVIGLGIENMSRSGFSYDVLLGDVTLDSDREYDVQSIAAARGTELTVAKAKDDAEFIAHARQDVPALLAEVERLRHALNGGLAHIGEVIAERDAFAMHLVNQIQLHKQRPGHEQFDHRACQNCEAFKALSEHPAIRAAHAELFRGLLEAIESGNFVACPAPEDTESEPS